MFRNKYIVICMFWDEVRIEKKLFFLFLSILNMNYSFIGRNKVGKK